MYFVKKNQLKFNSSGIQFNSFSPYIIRNNMHVHKECSLVLMPPFITPPSLIAKKTVNGFLPVLAPYL